jgi:hypothetical protein
LLPQETFWPGKIQFIITGNASVGGSIVGYYYVNRQNGSSGSEFTSIIGSVDKDNPLTGPTIAYEFANSSTATTPLAQWSGNSNVDPITENGYICSSQDGTPGTPVLAKLYKVVEGDSMAIISQKAYGTTARANDIKAANAWLMGLDNWGLVPGTMLTIPT